VSFLLSNFGSVEIYGALCCRNGFADGVSLEREFRSSASLSQAEKNTSTPVVVMVNLPIAMADLKVAMRKSSKVPSATFLNPRRCRNTSR